MKLQVDFPYLKEYRKKFKVTDRTIFAYNKEIYSNYPLSEDLSLHEVKHIEQQNRIGADVWVKRYLNNDQFRLNEEVEAYKAQLDFIKDKNQRYKLKILCARTLSSDLYGNIIEFDKALKLL